MKKMIKKLISAVMILVMVISFMPALTLSAEAAGESWTAQTSGVPTTLTGVCYGASTFVAVGENGSILTSTNGTGWSNWTGPNAAATDSNHLNAVCYGDGLFMAVGANGKVVTSADGIIWTAKASVVAPNNLVAVAYGAGKFVALAEEGYIYTSNDSGTSWTQTGPFSGCLYGICFGGNKFVVVGGNGSGLIYTSPDGNIWTPCSTAPATQTLTSVCYGTSYIAIDTVSHLLASPDATVWTNPAQPDAADPSFFYSVCYGETTYVVVGYNGHIYKSTDGTYWIPAVLGTSNALYGVCYSSNLFVAVGANGLILTSGSFNTPPTVTAPDTISYTDTSDSDTFGLTTGAITASDDDGTVESFGIYGGTAGSSSIGGITYDVSRAGIYGTLYVSSSDGTYAFSPNSAAINAVTSNKSETFTVTATDNGSATGSATLTVSITGANDTPTDIALSSAAVSKSGGTNATVGTLSSTDRDSGQTYTYSLVSGNGANDRDNASFNILGSALRANNASSLAVGTYNVYIRTTDSGGSYFDKAFVITVSDNTPPTVSSVSVPANGSYSAGQNLDFTVNFDEAVIVNTGGGTPRIALDLDGISRYAAYLSGSSSTALVFRYTVQAGDTDTDGIAVSGLQTNGGSLRDAAGNNANLTLNSMGSTTAVLVDAAAPGVPTIAISSDTGTSDSDGITKSTSQAITVSGEVGASVNLDFGDGSPHAVGAIGAGGTFTSPAHTYASGKYTITASLTDTAGNTSASGSKTVVIDTAAPSITTSANRMMSTTAASDGATVCALAATDATAISGFSDSLVWSVTGGTDSGKFSVSASNLRINNTGGLSAGSYTVQITAADISGHTDEQTITVSVVSGPTVSPAGRTYNDTSSNDHFTNLTGSISASANSGAITGYGVSDGTTGGSTSIGGKSYDVSKAGTYGTLYVKSSDGSYVYVPTSDSELNALTVTVSDTYTIEATDSAGKAGNTLTVTINGTNDTPVLTAPSAVNVVDGSTAAFTATATDPEGSAVTWSITGGADQTRFSVVAATGAVSFLSPPAFSDPDDADANNSYVLEITASDGVLTAVKTVTVTVTQKTIGGGGHGGGGSTSTGTTVVEVNGQQQDAGVSTTGVTSDGQSVTTINVDDSKLGKLLDVSGTQPVVTLQGSGSDVVIGQLSGQTLNSMEQKDAVLEIKTSNASYILPASQLNIGSIQEQLGSSAELQDIRVSVKIAAPPAATVRSIEDAAARNSLQLVANPVEFGITCTSRDKTVDISKFSDYVARTMAIPDGIDPAMITTGVVLNTNGIVTHVPTQIIMDGSRYYAKINSLTNSVYSVVYNPVAFSDVSGHWAKEAVNDMGSRMIVTGTGKDAFAPDRSITRAEFAAIVVRALGLQQGTSESSFTDVALTNWFNGYVDTAMDYTLITGFDKTSFRPNDTITREQAMAILARAMKLTGLEISLNESETNTLLSNYTDRSAVSGYAEESVAACIKAGVVSGSSETALSPKASVTRAEVAVMIQRLLEKSNLI